jgi:hypothetical protein
MAPGLPEVAGRGMGGTGLHFSRMPASMMEVLLWQGFPALLWKW